MFVAGMAPWLRVPMMVTTLLIAVPTGIKIFSWIATLWNGKIHFTTPMLWAVGFIAMFTIGGLSGVYLGSVPIDIHANQTYFIVAHIHYVLFGGSIFTVFAGIYYWFPKMTGRMYNERLGKLHFWLTFITFNLTFFPMHYIGLQGMPRRVADYAKHFADLNLFISIASFGLGASTLVFLYNMIRSWRYGARPARTRGASLTLEWQVSSPPPIFNFDEIPQVVGGPYEYGVPGARHAIIGGASSPNRSQRRPRSAWSHVLVIANETAASPALLDSAPRAGCRRGRRPRHGDRAGQRAAPRLRRLPGHAPCLGRTAARQDARASARLGRSRHRASSSIRAPCRRPRTRSRSSSRLPTRSSSRPTRSSARAGCAATSSARSRVWPAACPSRHVVAADEAAAVEANVLVVANETVISKALLDRVRERAAKGPASFLIVAPQSDDMPHPDAARRLRRALSELRSEGIDAHGQVVHPDPYTAAMDATHDERIDEIIVSTFPSARSGWLRRDLVGRLRSETGLPVDHVVSEDVE